MVQSGIEDELFIFCSTFYFYNRKRVIPTCAGGLHYSIERKTGNFLFHVLTCILNAYIRNTHLHGDLFVGFRIVFKPNADVIAAHLSVIFRVELILSGMDIPLGFDALHLALLLPITAFLGCLAEFHHEIDWKNGLRIVAESTEEFASLDFRVANKADSRPGLVRQSFAQIQEDIPLPCRESEATQPRARRSGSFSLDVILGQHRAIIARMCDLVFVMTSVVMVIYFQFT